jgi:transposase-like protein
MSAKNFTEEFKIEAVKQINEQGYPVSEVAARLEPHRFFWRELSSEVQAARTLFALEA